MGKFPTLSVPIPVNGSGAASSGSRTPAEDWELECEICGRQGINRVCVFFVPHYFHFIFYDDLG